ncbi:hypothetical protein [Variovorax sp. PAMC26660]|uniref:hypothetical protein n=1 Tax=Variovorax sp. PAMC26660 TaxID=2762322 RepID=UPI00164DCF1B|nr:hypothetical protein [Variovorax sp. PAMC26660]QNK65828.1 hypothetical protein H7F35_21770 [Variovorax sp. PAMC26660]
MELSPLKLVALITIPLLSAGCVPRVAQDDPKGTQETGTLQRVEFIRPSATGVNASPPGAYSSIGASAGANAAAAYVLQPYHLCVVELKEHQFVNVRWGCNAKLAPGTCVNVFTASAEARQYFPRTPSLVACNNPS